jgi:hypothetical protein
MQDPMSFHQFASQLPKVFDTIAKRGEKVLVEKDGILFRLEPEEKPQDIWATAVAERCARLRETLRSQNKWVTSRALDLIIAATALEYRLTLVTKNRDDFKDIPDLSLYQPHSGEL